MPAQVPSASAGHSSLGHPASSQEGSDSAQAVKTPTCLDRSQILDATARVLREKGYDGTTIRTIAKQLDCAVGSIYRYFKDKRQLLDAVCQRRFDAVAEHAELRSPVSKTVLMYARVAAEQPEQYRLMFWLASIGKQQQSEALPAIVRRILAGWTESMHDQAKARRTWATLHGAVNLGLAPEQILTLLDLTDEGGDLSNAGEFDATADSSLRLADGDGESSY